VKLTRHLLASVILIAALSGCGTDGGPTQPTTSLDTTPPPAPTNLGFSVIGTQRQLTWDSSAAADLAGYEVWQAECGSGEFVLAGSIVGDNASFTLPVVDQPKAMDFRVRAYDLTGNRSPYSGLATTELLPQSGAGDPNQPRTGRISE
jgi:hypothetical protein